MALRFAPQSYDLAMLPATFQALAVIVVAVLPGACFLWGFERRVGQWGATATDRVLYFIAAAAGFHILAAWAVYAIWREHFASQQAITPGRFAIVWAAIVIGLVIPTLAGLAVGSYWSAHRIPRNLYRAWDYVTARDEQFFRIRTRSGAWLGGYFGAESIAGEFPHSADLYLEQTYMMRDDGEFGEPAVGGVFVPADQIAWIEVVTIEAARGGA